MYDTCQYFPQEFQNIPVQIIIFFRLMRLYFKFKVLMSAVPSGIFFNTLHIVIWYFYSFLTLFYHFCQITYFCAET